MSDRSNLLCIKHPEIALEWDHQKNNSTLLHKVTCDSTLKLGWIGKCGHKWEDTVLRRSTGNGCPLCKAKETKSLTQNQTYGGRETE